MNLEEYVEVDDIDNPKHGDIVYQPELKRVEIVVGPDTDLIQEEYYPLLENFGCVLLRRK